MKKTLLILIILLIIVFGLSAESTTLRLRAIVPEVMTFSFIVDKIQAINPDFLHKEDFRIIYSSDTEVSVKIEASPIADDDEMLFYEANGVAVDEHNTLIIEQSDANDGNREVITNIKPKNNGNYSNRHLDPFSTKVTATITVM